MSNYSLLRDLMRRDKLTQQEALEEIQDMRRRVQSGEDPEEVLHEAGFEPDYVFDLL